VEHCDDMDMLVFWWRSVTAARNSTDVHKYRKADFISVGNLSLFTTTGETLLIGFIALVLMWLKACDLSPAAH